MLKTTPMSVPLKLSSLQNPRVKRLMKLRKRSQRDEEDVFLLEGYREMTRALACEWPIEELYFCPELFLGENEPELLEGMKEQGAKLFECSEAVFRKIAYRDRPDGLLAIAPQLHLGLGDIPDLENPFLLVLVGIEKPGNLGTMLRSADGAGVDAVILCESVTDVFNPNCVRASVGTLFSVPVIECDRKELMSWCQAQGVPLLAATPHTERKLTEMSLSGPVAVAMGSEMHGLPEVWMNEADVQVCLPMYGIADSLNVSSCAAILLYELRRQREQAGT